jgi:hypothetical protein
MSVAKTHKLKEYGTDILSHSDANTTASDGRMRATNTFKSSAFEQADMTPT